MATYYIATTGNDNTGDGSSSNPWLTLQKFLDTSSDNDILIVKDGTYTLTANVTISQRTIQAENNGLAIFDGGSIQISISLLQICFLNGLVFQNFLTSSNSNFSMFRLQGSSEFENCIFANNMMHESTGVAQGGMFRPFGSELSNLTFRACVWRDNYRNEAVGLRSAYFVADNPGNSSVNVYIYNSTFVENRLEGFSVKNLFYSVNNDVFPSVIIKNTIFYNVSGSDFRVAYLPSNFTSFITSHCNYYNVLDDRTPAILVGDGIITSDPIFIDPANNNYNLSPSSPCIDAGTLI